MLADTASNRAISARLRPGNCCLVSAQNHTQIGATVYLCNRVKIPEINAGKANAAPISKHPSNAKPASSPSQIRASGTVVHSKTSAAIECTLNRDAVASTHARGLILAKIGICAICQIWLESAAAVPTRARNRPDTHQEVRSSSVPEICAP